MLIIVFILFFFNGFIEGMKKEEGAKDLVVKCAKDRFPVALLLIHSPLINEKFWRCNKGCALEKDFYRTYGNIYGTTSSEKSIIVPEKHVQYFGYLRAKSSGRWEKGAGILDVSNAQLPSNKKPTFLYMKGVVA
ncbi:MAG TPA: hypothetical protein VEK38_01765 [Candidatus Bathyarchaeia archaeon]|nr:hypothetical protein [Candidatus Bathyarchaeia archaeon]